MKLSFHGAVREVTGSCFLIETQSANLMVDCGFFQGERFCGTKNYEAFDFDPKIVDAVVITHAHYDHTGRLPLLVKEGFTGKIFATPPTIALAKLVLEDAFRIMYDEARKCGTEPLYEKHHLEEVFQRFTGMNYHTTFSPAGKPKVMFHNAGHILGSCYISVDIPAGEMHSGQEARFVFSGDLGNDDVPILPSTEVLRKADYVITESTYGNRDHSPTDEREDVLKAFIKKVVDRGGVAMIPAFSLERTQELLYAIDALVDRGELPRVPIFLDSPLAIKSTAVYRHFKTYLEFDRPILDSPDKDFFSFKGLKETLSVDESKSINEHHGPKIIIAGSGMMSGGRIMHHLKRYLPNEQSGLLIIGYQAVGTTGRAIQDGAEIVTIDGEKIPVKAEIQTMDSFSAHGDRSKVRRWLQPQEGPAKKVFLVHGDEEVKPEFSKYLKEQIPGEVIVPEFQQGFTL